MSHRQNKASFSAQKGGLSVQELKQMTAKRMAEGQPKSQPNNSLPPSTSHSRGYPSPDPHKVPARSKDRHSPTLTGRVPASSAPPNPQSSSNNNPQSHHSTANITTSPLDKGLSVLELKALTRMRLAREAVSGPCPNPSSNHAPKSSSASPHRSNFSPSSTYPQMNSSSDKRPVDDYLLGHHGSQTFPLSALHGGLSTRSGNTSPTVDSSSTGSDSEHVAQVYRVKHHTSPHSSSAPRQGYHPSKTSSYNSSIESLDSFDPILLPPRRVPGRGGKGGAEESYHDSFAEMISAEKDIHRDHYHRDHHINLRHDRTVSSDSVVSGIHPELQTRLLSLEQQQIARDRRQRERERQLELERERERERLRERELQAEREHQHYLQQQRQQLSHKDREEFIAPLSLDIPPLYSELHQSHVPCHRPPPTGNGSRQVADESCLLKKVLNKSINSGNSSCYDPPPSSSSSAMYNFDHSLLPSSSPFFPSVSTSPGPSPSPQAFHLPSDIEPSPPTSPRSLRNASRRPLSISCPAPVRIRSSSDSNDLACAVAESVLLTPTAGSPATSFRKGIATSPSSRSSSRRNSTDSTRGSLSAISGNIIGIGFNCGSGSGSESVSNSNSVSNGGGGSVASGGGNSSVLDVDNIMFNQFSLDSNDEVSNTNVTVDMSAVITDL